MLNLLNLIYYICFEFGDIDSFKYLSARFVQFSIFSITIYSFKNDFPRMLIKFLKFVTISTLLASFIFYFPDFQSRYSGIFINPNEFSILMVIGFSIVLFVEKIIFKLFIIVFVFVSSSYIRFSFCNCWYCYCNIFIYNSS